MTRIELARQKYKPDKIKYLLVAETPPKSDSDRFFYFEDVNEQDSLFLETIKVLYPSEIKILKPKEIRKVKKIFLEKFKKDGFYLIDSLDTPFEAKYKKKKKIKLLMLGQNELLNKIKNLSDCETNVILIAIPVYDANYLFLKQNGVNIINKGPIEFPGSGGQIKYKDKIKKLIKLQGYNMDLQSCS